MTPQIMERRTGNAIHWTSFVMFLFFFFDSFNWVDALGELDFRLSYIVLALGILLSLFRTNILTPKIYVYVFAFLLLVSLPGLIQHPQTWRGLISQLVGSIPFAYLAYIIVQREGLENIYVNYLFIAKFIVASVFVEQSLYLVGGIDLIKEIWIFTIANYDVGSYYRASGILYEPSQVGLLLPPALYLSIRRNDYKLALLILLGIILSFSTLGYIGALFSLLFSVKLNSKVAPLIIIGVVVVVCIILIVPSSRDRVEKGYNLLASSSIQHSFTANELAEMRGTVATLIVNSNITYSSVADSPFFGHGIGSFRYMYEGYLYGLYGDVSHLEALQNRQGGASLFLRMIFEVGVLGTLFIFFVYLYRLISLKNRRKNYIGGDCAYDLSIAATIFFLCCLLRKDMIVTFYFWMFMTIFLISTQKSVYKIQ